MASGARGRTGYEGVIKDGVETRRQFVEINGPCRIDVTRIAELLEPRRPRHFVVEAAPVILTNRLGRV